MLRLDPSQVVDEVVPKKEKELAELLPIDALLAERLTDICVELASRYPGKHLLMSHIFGVVYALISRGRGIPPGHSASLPELVLA